MGSHACRQRRRLPSQCLVTVPHDVDRPEKSRAWSAIAARRSVPAILARQKPRNTKDPRGRHNPGDNTGPRLPFHTMGINPRNHRCGGRETRLTPCPGAKQPKNRQMPRILVRGDSHVSCHSMVAVPHHAFKAPISPTRKARAPVSSQPRGWRSVVQCG